MPGNRARPALGPVRPACAPFELGTLVRPRWDLLGRVSDAADYASPLVYGLAAHFASCGLTVLLRWSRSDDCHREDDRIG